MALLKLRPFVVSIIRYTSQSTPGKGASSTTAAKSTTVPPSPPPKPVTSAAAKATSPTEDPTKYNVPEYYTHNEYSYYDIDIGSTKYRVPQPNKYDPLTPKK